MRTIKIVKYTEFCEVRSVGELPIHTERAVADYMAFLPVATVHADRVTNDEALDVMLEVVGALQTKLTQQKNRLQSV